MIHIQKAVDPPGNARARLPRSICDLARRLGQGAVLSRSASRARSSRSCARPRAAASPTTTASPTRRSTRRWASSGPARRWIIPARRGCSRAAGSSTRTARRASWSPNGARAAIRWTPSFPSTSRPAAWSASTSPARRRGASARWWISIPSRKLEIHPRLAEQHGIADRRLGRRSRRGATAITLQAHGGAHDPAGHGLHPVPLAGRAQRQPADAPHARSAQQDPRVQGLGLPASRKSASGRPREDRGA